MLALTAVTAVQRFVKVWRQATPDARRARHLRTSDEPRAGTLAQWWAAHRTRFETRGDRSSPTSRRS
jgi:hypothetical protein